jgi:hypothetical protein
MSKVWLVGLLSAACMVGMAGPAMAYHRCELFTGTADGLVKDEAVGDSREALQEEITAWKSDHHVSGVPTPAKPKPHPYWRDDVAADLYVKPDVVDSKAYTICWHGVVSPVVCTSGARLCE